MLVEAVRTNGQPQSVPSAMLRLLTATRNAAGRRSNLHSVAAAATFDARARSPRRTATFQRSVWSCWILHHIDHPLNDSGREVIATSLDLDPTDSVSKRGRECPAKQAWPTLKRSRPICSSSSSIDSTELESDWPADHAHERVSLKGKINHQRTEAARTVQDAAVSLPLRGQQPASIAE